MTVLIIFILFFVSFILCCCQCLHYTALNDRMIMKNELKMIWKTWSWTHDNHEKSARITGVPAEVRTQHFDSTSYSYISLLGP